MNIANLTIVRDAIAADSPDHPAFLMAHFRGSAPVGSAHKCGTSACIGGMALAIFHPGVWKDLDSPDNDPDGLMLECLGLTDDQGDVLFYTFCDDEAAALKHLTYVIENPAKWEEAVEQGGAEFRAMERAVLA